MFQILLIAGLLLASVQQGLARGAVDVSAPVETHAVAIESASAVLKSSDCCDEQAVPETKPSYCKNSDCKAVIAALSAEPNGAGHFADWQVVAEATSAPKRLEPRPPNT